MFSLLKLGIVMACISLSVYFFHFHYDKKPFPAANVNSISVAYETI